MSAFDEKELGRVGREELLTMLRVERARADRLEAEAASTCEGGKHPFAVGIGPCGDFYGGPAKAFTDNGHSTGVQAWCPACGAVRLDGLWHLARPFAGLKEVYENLAATQTRASQLMIAWQEVHAQAEAGYVLARAVESLYAFVAEGRQMVAEGLVTPKDFRDGIETLCREALEKAAKLSEKPAALPPYTR